MIQTPKMVLTCKVGTNFTNIISNFNNCNTSLLYYYYIILFIIIYLAAFMIKNNLSEGGKEEIGGKK